MIRLGSNYGDHFWPRSGRVIAHSGQHLLVLPDDEPQCVASTTRKTRCRNRLDIGYYGDGCTTCRTITLDADSDPPERVQLQVLPVGEDDIERILVQRCDTHFGSNAADHVAPEWERFDLERHAHLVVRSISGNVRADTSALLYAFDAGVDAWHAHLTTPGADRATVAAEIAEAVRADVQAWLDTGTSPQAIAHRDWERVQAARLRALGADHEETP